MIPLFVYGTLKRGCKSHAYLAGQTFLAETRTLPGYRLLLLDGYPGLVPATDDREGVTGELWSVSAECLEALDRFEGLAEGLYRREAVPLDKPHLSADAYLYAQSGEGRRVLGAAWTE